MARKRARGAGRKPKGEFAGKTSTFTTRILPETRHALERAAKQSERSLSQQVEWLLRAALKKPSPEQVRNQALAHIVATLAADVEKATGRSWQEDAFTSRAVGLATDTILFHFGPAKADGGEPVVPERVESSVARMPPDFAARYRTPAGLGQTIAFAVISEIESAARSNTRMNDEWTATYQFVPEEIARILARDLKGGAK
jgi:hypothetical protein